VLDRKGTKKKQGQDNQIHWGFWALSIGGYNAAKLSKSSMTKIEGKKKQYKFPAGRFSEQNEEHERRHHGTERTWGF